MTSEVRRVLVIVNDQPYGSERPYTALRVAGALAKRYEVELRAGPMCRYQSACCVRAPDAAGARGGRSGACRRVAQTYELA